jgi:hypothetical protein
MGASLLGVAAAATAKCAWRAALVAGSAARRLALVRISGGGRARGDNKCSTHHHGDEGGTKKSIHVSAPNSSFLLFVCDCGHKQRPKIETPNNYHDETLAYARRASIYFCAELASAGINARCGESMKSFSITMRNVGNLR